MLNRLAVRIRQAFSKGKSIPADKNESPNTPGNLHGLHIPSLQHTPLQTRVDGMQSVVHLLYSDVNDPPPRPNAPHTRFICVSDTHSQVFDVPLGDVLLHSGDLSSRGKIEDFQVTLDWLCSLPHKIKM